MLFNRKWIIQPIGKIEKSKFKTDKFGVEIRVFKKYIWPSISNRPLLSNISHPSYRYYSSISIQDIKIDIINENKLNKKQLDPLKSIRIVDIIDHQIQPSHIIHVQGWIRTVREQKSQTFVELNDGSSCESLQIVINVHESKLYAKERPLLSTGMAIKAKGRLEYAPNSKKLELIQPEIEVVGECEADYPLQKKRHSLAYLRDLAHLRSRTNTFGAMLRLRNIATMSIHDFFQHADFIQIHTPIINANDCEGAGELFHIHTLSDLEPSSPPNKIRNDFFNQDECFLTVSGQLEAELFASSMSKIYTFGPTFRAENSHTPRHLSEFWMIEPEVAFTNLDDIINLAESMVKSSVDHVIQKGHRDLQFFQSRFDTTLMDRLHHDQDHPYTRINYREAIEALKKAKYNIHFGQDLSREHERWLCEEYTKRPVFITNYPSSIKPFYMRASKDKETVDCFDLLVPKIGELIGGSAREERLDYLIHRMHQSKMGIEKLQWYLDLRRYGSVPHGGYGMGFERFMLYITGMENARDVIPIPRYPKYCKF